MFRSLILFGLVMTTAGLAGCGAVTQGSSAAATVNGRDISMAAYNEEVHYKRIVSVDESGIDVCNVKSMVSLCKLLKRDALTSLIEDELVREYASKHGIAITDAEFRRQWTIIFRDRFHDMNAVVAANAKRYGMTVAQLKASIRMDLLRNAVMFQVTRAMPSTLPAVRLSRIVAATPKQMKVIERRLTSGVPFNQLATSLSAEKKNLCVTAGCGEMGWVPNVFISTPEHAVLTAPTGTVVGPIPGQTMIELLKVEGHSPAKPLTPNQSLQHRQQLFSAWQAHQVQKASVKRYVAT